MVNGGKSHRSSEAEGCRLRGVCMDCSTGGWEKGKMPPDCSETETCERFKFSKAL